MGDAVTNPGITPDIIIVDLDGTLIRSDLLVESFFNVFGDSPARATALVGRLLQGKAALKAGLADAADLDVSLLPYNAEVLAWLKAARERGSRLYLASASHDSLVDQVADHLGLFDGWMGSDGLTNLAGAAKARHIREVIGEAEFAYLGNGAADLPIWRQASLCVAVDCPAGVRRRLLGFAPGALFLGASGGTVKSWLKLLRVRQYVKNTLVAVPLLVSHQISWANIGLTLLAFAAFSLCASAVYIINDLIDIAADRRHATKRNRPLASGAVSILAAPPVALLLLAAFGVGVLVGPLFVAILVLYAVLTTAYTLSLKRKMIIDAVVLAMLYSIRMLAGAAAIHVVPSEWLIGFSLFIFSSLAFVKRYIELARHQSVGRTGKLNNRNYDVADLAIVGGLGAACGLNSITFLALYISSDAVKKLYAHPQVLWIACPVIMYWVGRNLLLAHRGLMDDDPIVFALTDRPSLMCAAVIGAAAVLATF